MTRVDLVPLMADEGEARPLNFVEEIWHYLSPFSAHRIEMWGERFPTVEHAYHCAKFMPGEARDRLKDAGSPLACLYLSRALKVQGAPMVPDFDKEAVMESLMRAKLEQHPEVREVLRLTGKRCLLKGISTDAYWGVGPDGSGENVMGKIWMRLREEEEQRG